MKKAYETAMINHGGRNGEVEAPNGSMHMKITPPGIHAEGTNPEQLFAAGYASLFQWGGTTYDQRSRNDSRVHSKSTCLSL